MNRLVFLRFPALLLLLVFTGACLQALADPAEWRVYIGTYTGGKSEGIYLFTLNAASGKIEGLTLAATVENPSFLAIHPHEPWLYSVGQGMGPGGERMGLMSAFSMDAQTGLLTLVNQQSTVGEGPCHVAIDHAGRHALAANYGNGSLVVLPIGEGGALGEACDYKAHEGSSIHPERQKGPHAHSVTLDPTGRYVFVADLGLDKLMTYRYDDASGALASHEPAYAEMAPGAGPRHFAFHPTGRFAYVVNELDNTITAFSYNADQGRLESIHSVTTLPEDFDAPNTTAEIRVHPLGRFVYASNRGHDSIAAFLVNEESGHLTPLGQTPTGGKTPRNFNVTPDGKLLLAANQQTDTVVVFRINPDSGALEETGQVVEIPSPVCVLFLVPQTVTL